jgi:hypothetical protein
VLYRTVFIAASIDNLFLDISEKWGKLRSEEGDIVDVVNDVEPPK